MTGQWLGAFEGEYTGTLIVNADELRDCYGGSAAFLPSDSRYPGIQVAFRTDSTDAKFHAKTINLWVVNPTTGQRDSWENVKAKYPNVQVPNSATLDGSQ
jgi:hypothetical protein